MKNKILISTLLFITLFLTFVIPCFAYDFNGVLTEGDIILWNETLSSDFSTGFQFDFYLTSNPDYSYNVIEFSYPGRVVLKYNNEFDESVTVYDDGWLDEDYRSITADGSIILSGDSLGFISVNAEVNPHDEGLYDTVYNFIKPTIFGDREPDGAENFVLILLVSIFTLGFIILPLIIVWLIIKGILSASRGVWG